MGYGCMSGGYVNVFVCMHVGCGSGVCVLVRGYGCVVVFG